ncbi:hypothetical protein J4Q44_G00377920 [Coregonus suidteri]|uniref:Neurotransmitter-gated ion-channel ligand-binding domain-containing protein n=1 Tax=Coregonus suidteri TaxID=861788 RepID=A0AAN8KGH9_9TELE
MNAAAATAAYYKCCEPLEDSGEEGKQELCMEVLPCVNIGQFARAKEGEKKLMKDLFSNHNLKVRPAASPQVKVVVRVGMIHFSFVSLEWTDHRLSWNPKDHDGIEVMRLPAGKVWLPDIVLINNNDGVFHVALHVAIQAYNSGRVTWSPPALFCSSCGVTYFPFDWQNCTMVFKSYTYDSSEVDLQYALDNQGNEIKEIQYDEGFSESGEW